MNTGGRYSEVFPSRQWKWFQDKPRLFEVWLFCKDFYSGGKIDQEGSVHLWEQCFWTRCTIIRELLDFRFVILGITPLGYLGMVVQLMTWIQSIASSLQSYRCLNWTGTSVPWRRSIASVVNSHRAGEGLRTTSVDLGMTKITSPSIPMLTKLLNICLRKEKRKGSLSGCIQCQF